MLDEEVAAASGTLFEGGVLYASPQDYLSRVSEGDARGRSAFTEEMWGARDFAELTSLLARRSVTDSRDRAKVEARSRKNIILNVDSYKVSMPFQYPQGTEYVYSYVESRGGRYDRTPMVGLQIFADEYLSVPVTHEMVDEAADVYGPHGVTFHEEGWRYVVDELGGRLPLSIRAVDEGTVVPTRNVLATVVNTDPKCWWLTTHVETALLPAIWYPTTVAARSLAARRVIKKWLDKTSDNGEALLPSRLHDFGARSATSAESASLGGLGHLFVFAGTDTVGALVAARRHYGATMPAYSVDAAEHSTITSWGEEREVDAYRNMLRRFAKPGSYVAVVSDSYDLWNAIDKIWGVELRQHVIDSGATVIVRPDSGDVYTVPVEAVRRLAEKFGYEVNTKGYKVLRYVRALQGDGIDDENVIDKILANLAAAGFAVDNLAFGMGSGLLQKLNRDTQAFAMKASAICVDGAWREVYKRPATDLNKASKRGRLALVRDADWETVPLEGNKWRDQLHEVFRDGLVTRRTTLEAGRERVAAGA